MTYYIYAENARMFGNTYVSSSQLNGNRPGWVPKSVWALAHQFKNLGAKDAIFGATGEIWRIRHEGTKNAGINHIDKANPIIPRAVRSRGGYGANIGIPKEPHS